MAGKPQPRASVVQPLDSSYRLIALTQNQITVVDAVDYDSLAVFPWYARWDKTTKTYYAMRNAASCSGRRITVMMHRQILGLPHGDPRKGDHADTKQTLLNTRDNLRIANLEQSAENKGKYRNNTSGFKGVSFDSSVKSKPWKASINSKGKKINLGRSATKEGAYILYCAGAKLHHGEFARVA